jgi:DNA mismatch repair protein MutS
MQVDSITLKDIGLLDSEAHVGLATHLNFCKTNGGSFTFTELLSTPLSNKQSIEIRQEAIQLFIQHKNFFEKLKTTNGTTLVIDKFFETGFKKTSPYPNWWESALYKLFNKADYSLLKYSVEHVNILIQDFDQWLLEFSNEKHNPIIEKWYVEIEKILTVEVLSTVRKNDFFISTQNILQLSYFYTYHYKNQLKRLLQLLYEIDAYNSLATAKVQYNFEFPIWVEQEQPLFIIQDAKHPLVENAISNPLQLNDQQNFLFLTGANMAGKSTFIKTIAIVIYLAHIGMGAPGVNIQLTVMDGLITNLTIADNIIKGESYFFNEVQRIKNTVEKIKDGKKYFVLIDELFKGTNIQDAMKCSIAVIEGLQKIKSSLFIISTHLYEISSSLTKFPNIQFKYFETTVNKQELVFHYQLKEGVSQDRIGYLILEREGVVKMLDNL